jgi:hypothetical protein
MLKTLRFLVSVYPVLLLLIIAAVIYKIPKCQKAHGMVCDTMWEIHDFIEKG